MTTILTRRRGGPHSATHWAAIEGEPGTIGSGPTAAAAIGALVRQLPGRFGVTIRELDVIPDLSAPTDPTADLDDEVVAETVAELKADAERRRARLDGVIAEAAATTDGILAEIEAAKEAERAEYEAGCRTVMLRRSPPRRSFDREPDALAMEFDDDLFEAEDDPLARTQIDMAPSPVLVEVMATMAFDEEMAALNDVRARTRTA